MSGILQALLASSSPQGGAPSFSIYATGNSGNTLSNTYTITDIPAGAFVLVLIGKAKTTVFNTHPYEISAPGDVASDRDPFSSVWTAVTGGLAIDTHRAGLGIVARRFIKETSSITLTGNTDDRPYHWTHLVLLGVDLFQPFIIRGALGNWGNYASLIDTATNSAIVPATYEGNWQSPTNVPLLVGVSATAADNILTPPAMMSGFELDVIKKNHISATSYYSETIVRYDGEAVAEYLAGEPVYGWTPWTATASASTSSCIGAYLELRKASSQLRPDFIARNTSEATTLSLPAISANELVIVACGKNSTTNLTLNISTSGWSKLTDLYGNGSNQDANLSVFYRVFTEDTPAHSITFSTSVAAVSIGVLGANTATPFESTISTATATRENVTVPTKTIDPTGVLISFGYSSGQMAQVFDSPDACIRDWGGVAGSESRLAMAVFSSDLSGQSLGEVLTTNDVPTQYGACAATLAIKAA